MAVAGERAGLNGAEQFLDNLHANMITVTKVFMSLPVEWSNQVGTGNENEGRIRKLLGDLDDTIKNLASPRRSPPSRSVRVETGAG